MSFKRGRPLVNRVLIRHGKIASTAQGQKIVDAGGAALGFRDVMPRLEIKDIDGVLAPPDKALSLEHEPGSLNPDLLSEGLGNRGLSIRTRLCVAHRVSREGTN
jgi:hypothetical protein